MCRSNRIFPEPFGLPSFLPSDFILARASFVLELINSRSISEAREKAKANILLEVLTAIKRAGANLIITYYAKEALKWLAGASASHSK